MGESARKPGAPQLPVSVEELLTPLPGEGYSWFEKTFPPIATAFIFGGGPAVQNLRMKRPFFAGIHRHIILGAIGYALGDWIFRSRRAQRAEKDAILLHYVSLHPSDFPHIARQRYKDVFLPWTPIR